MRALGFATIFAFLADQITKYIVIHAMDLARLRQIDVVPPFLNFRYGENRGINFGLFGDGSDASRWILIGLAAVICIGVLVWVLRTPVGRLGRISAGFLIGGALGNVLDRLLYGYVLDFLNMSCCGIRNPFVFNVADVFVFAGAIGLVFFVKDPGSPARQRKKG